MTIIMLVTPINCKFGIINANDMQVVMLAKVSDKTRGLDMKCLA